jgi:formylglycine-generating enzyme required for sulfatase activity
MDIEMKFAWVPPGAFLMGGDQTDEEKPVHRVTISKGFFMGTYPVTQAQWQAVMGFNLSHFRGDDRPVETVSWEDCQEFCQKLRHLTGKPTRLPTEAEWEYACRAGTTSDYYSGNGEEALQKVGWYASNSDKQTQPVGKRAANAWGLFDMHGNVWEWCADWYGPYPKEDQKDPQGCTSGAPACCAAAPGTSRRCAAAPLAATGARRGSVTASSAAGCACAWTDLHYSL